MLLRFDGSGYQVLDDQAPGGPVSSGAPILQAVQALLLKKSLEGMTQDSPPPTDEENAKNENAGESGAASSHDRVDTMVADLIAEQQKQNTKDMEKDPKEVDNKSEEGILDKSKSK